ncbi:MAG TPA: HAMP domain-containing sensor histidine kinase, partial [Terriglobales bacterium]|nr:HAMP domain-containing sensor histidine kinase [Terriglobales bacterium]
TAQASAKAAVTIFRESQRLVAMINTYLEVLRLDSGVRPLRVKETSVERMIDHVEQIIRPLAQSASVSIRTKLIAQDATIDCDEALVSGVILNLLSNAIKYSPQHSEVTLSVTPRERELEFSVRNSGPAIAAAELEHLFEKFYRSPQHSESISGWGLGLTFVKRICEQHGGRVAVSSDSDSGTCFSFTLPLASRAVAEALQ